MRRGVQLPKRTDLLALPAPNGCPLAFLRLGMSQRVRMCPSSDCRPIRMVLESPKGLRGRKVVRRRWLGAQHPTPKLFHLPGNRSSAVSPGNTGLPFLGPPFGTGSQILRVERSKPPNTHPQFIGSFTRRYLSVANRFHQVPDQARTMTPPQLMPLFFMDRSYAMTPINGTTSMPNPPLQASLPKKGSFSARIRKF